MAEKKGLQKLLGKAVSAVAQEQNHHDPHKTVTHGMPEKIRAAAAQGAVLLASYGKGDGITLGELQENAKAVLQCAMDLKIKK